MELNELVGKTLISITGAEIGNDRIEFKTDKGEKYVMYHSQDCGEIVQIDDINGDILDLIGTPILDASERTSDENRKDEYDESWEWTFYDLSTIKGHVQIKWYGTSNGYYSESVDFEKINYINQYR